jgi:uncharacterized protein (TIGR02001 family)
MRKLLVFGAMMAAASAAPAFAQDEVTVTGNVGIVTDYVWRNVSQSNYDLAIQGGIDVTTSSGFYVGTWASSIDFNDASDANVEVDVYGGYRFDLGGVAADVGVIYYAYPDADDIDFYEVYGKLSKTFDTVTIAGSLNYDPDNETLFADASVGVALTPEFSVSAGYGAYLDGFGEYNGWNVGGSWAVGGVTLGARYHDNDVSGLDESLVFSIGRAM